MKWWQRLLLSALSVAVGLVIAGFIAASFRVNVWGVDGWADTFIAVGMSGLFYAIPAALVALPLVFAFRSLDGFRLPLLASIGIVLGPASWLLLGVIERFPQDCGVSLSDHQNLTTITVLAAIGSFATTAIYIAVLKWSERARMSAPKTVDIG